jgi:hypothetical protein
MRRRLLLTLAVLAGLLCTLGAPGPALADPSNVVAINEDEYSHGTDILNARLGIERTTDSTQGRFRLRLRCFRLNPITGQRSPQLCDFSFGSGDDVCWDDLTAGTRVCGPLGGRSDTAEEVWTGTYRTLIRGHRYRAFVDDYRAHFNDSGYTGAYHDIYSLVYTH